LAQTVKITLATTYKYNFYQDAKIMHYVAMQRGRKDPGWSVSRASAEIIDMYSNSLNGEQAVVFY